MKNKYIFGGIIILIFFSFMAYLFTQTNISYENNFTKVINSHKTLKVTGSWVREQNYKYDKDKNLFMFTMRDENGNLMKVIYKGSIPNNFESATSVVVTGKYKDGYFHASDILTKCPSKYQEEYTAGS